MLKQTIESARAARDAQMQLCFDNAGEDWKEQAYQALLRFAQPGRRFLTEDVRLACGWVPAPHDNRAWGGVVTRAVKAGILRKVGYAPAVTGHCRPMPLWERA